MTQDFDYLQEVLMPFWAKKNKVTRDPMPELIDAVDSVDRLGDVKVLVEMALEQVAKAYEQGSTIHRLVLILENIQNLLETETDTLQFSLDRCRERLEDIDSRLN